MVVIKGYLQCDDCGCTELRLEYREFQVTKDHVEVIDHFRCPYCQHYARIPFTRTLEDAARAIEGEEDGEPTDSPGA